ncbi:hypothetical protein C5S29_11950 [ANME-1 cluster archaeon GoMg3.2]|nr:hypothetical protein [ANME-1 cluster archaeon GoMg3.2]
MRSAISSVIRRLTIPPFSFSLYSFPVAILQNAGMPSVGPEVITRSSSSNRSSLSGEYIHLEPRFIANTRIPASVSSFNPFSVLPFKMDVGLIFTFNTASSKSSRSRYPVISTEVAIFAMSPAAFEIFSAADAICNIPANSIASSKFRAPNIVDILIL